MSDKSTWRRDGCDTPSKKSNDADSTTSHQPERADDQISTGQTFNDSEIVPPPDGGYGWVCCGALLTVNIFTYGATASYGVYIAHYLAASSFPDATPFYFALIGGLSFGLSFLVSPLCTILTRRLSRAAVMILGSCLFAGGFIAASFARMAWQLLLTQGVVVGLGLGCVFVPSVQVLPQWFEKRRTLANGIASSGAGIGGIIFSLSTNAMIEHIGLAWSLRITGILCLAGNLVGTALMRDRNAIVKPPQLGFPYHLFKRYDCVLVICWACVNLMGYITLLYSFADYAVQVAGLSQTHATILTAVLNLGAAFGRPLMGKISDYFGCLPVAAIAELANAIFVFAIWLPASSYGLLAFFALIGGTTFGTYWVCIGPLCAEIAGLAEVPSFLSLNWVMIALPSMFAEVIALYLKRPTLGRRWCYIYSQIFTGVAFLISSLFLFELWRYRRSQRRKNHQLWHDKAAPLSIP